MKCKLGEGRFVYEVSKDDGNYRSAVIESGKLYKIDPLDPKRRGKYTGLVGIFAGVIPKATCKCKDKHVLAAMRLQGIQKLVAVNPADLVPVIIERDTEFYSCRIERKPR